MTQRAEFYGNGNRGPSLGEQIASAETIADVHALLAHGQSFNATSRTINRWKREAFRRITKLQGYPPQTANGNGARR